MISFSLRLKVSERISVVMSRSKPISLSNAPRATVFCITGGILPRLSVSFGTGRGTSETPSGTSEGSHLNFAALKMIAPPRLLVLPFLSVTPEIEDVLLTTKIVVRPAPSITVADAPAPTIVTFCATVMAPISAVPITTGLQAQPSGSA